MTSNKLRVQRFRTNDLNNNGGKQFELGKGWCEDFFEIDSSLPEAIIILVFKPLCSKHTPFLNKELELKLAETTNRGDRKAYANGQHGLSQIKNLFIDDLELTEEENLSDYFAIYKADNGQYYLYYVPKLLYDNFIKLFESITPNISIQRDSRKELLSFDSTYPLQQIFYGAPGTGKSHEVKKLTTEQKVIRTTFHPDSDYSTFVGCYKPTMDEVDTQVVPIVVNSGISLQSPGTYKEKRITYKFVKQVFLKAYLSAWKNYSNIHASSSTPSISIKTNSGQYTITAVDDSNVSYERIITYRLPNGNLTTTWDKIWESGSFIMPTGGSGRSLEQAISQWICNNIENCTKDDLEKGIETFKQQIKKNGEVAARKENGQIYVFSPNNDEVVFIVKTNSRNSKSLLKKAFESEDDYVNANEIIQKLVELLQTLDNDFQKAWNRLKEAVQNKSTEIPIDTVTNPTPQFLVIEEINRGNCAQIFGDLFQLLDRQGNGFSEYPIEADTDLQRAIAMAFKEEPEYMLTEDINVDGAVENYESNYGATLSEDIQNGRVLLLPPNLYIWATMNTSDQSLFPIDSAFKRRWEWKYMPINNHEDKGYQIEIGGVKYDWWGFLARINHVINDTTNSEDKKLGYFFAKAKGKTIDAEQFVGKVLFYLWNDVFKSYGFDDPIFSKGDNKKFEFSDFFMNDGNPNTDTVNLFLRKLEETIKMEGLPLEIIIDKQNETQPDSEPQEDEA